jgi:hypothetical protein
MTYVSQYLVRLFFRFGATVFHTWFFFSVWRLRTSPFGAYSGTFPSIWRSGRGRGGACTRRWRRCWTFTELRKSSSLERYCWTFILPRYSILLVIPYLFSRYSYQETFSTVFVSRFPKATILRQLSFVVHIMIIDWNLFKDIANSASHRQ